MATPNYGFEKRKREMAKKAAKEAKRLRKVAGPADAETPTEAAEPSPTPERAP